MSRTIDFQFLRDCIRSLRNDQLPNNDVLSMGEWMKVYPCPNNNWCGTPSCVIGHWAHQTIMEDPLIHPSARPYRIGWLVSEAITLLSSSGLTVHGLNECETSELFGARGCGDAHTKEEAIAYIEGFIVRHGGSLENPKRLDVTLVPDWEKLAEQPAAAEVAHACVSD